MITPLRVRGPLTEGFDPAGEGDGASGDGGGSPAAARRARKALSPEALVDLVADSGLRMRGGAGERVADCFRALRAQPDASRCVVAHAGPIGPGAAADRLLVEVAPHRVVEGLLIAARAIGADTIHLCLASGHDAGLQAAAQAIARARSTRSRAASATRVPKPVTIDGVTVELSVMPEGSTLCGEATALLEAIARGEVRPRPRPPPPCRVGLSGHPTWIVDAETCAHLALIVGRGAERFRELGDPDDPGTAIFEVSGDVERPGFYELPLGTRLGELLFEHAGGVSGGRKVGVVIPVGGDAAVLPPGWLDVPLLASRFAVRGASFGRGEIRVVAADSCMVAAAETIAASLRAASCGRAVHCRVAATWIHEVLVRMTRGDADEADLELLRELCDEVRSDRHCGLTDTVGGPVRSLVDLFPDEFAAHVRGAGCGRGAGGAFA